MMRNKWLIIAIALFLSNCAVYKQLEPKVPFTSAEEGYKQLERKQEKKFEVDKEKKYFISFPPPAEDNYYLVFKVDSIKQLKTSFTDVMGEKSNPGKRIKDESEKPDSLSVYPIGTGKTYYWLIDNVPDDAELPVDYRYVPQWRFKYESKYALYKKTLAENLVERKTYLAIGKTVKPEQLNTGRGIDTVSRHLAILEKIYEEILAIEKIFPKSILNSKDTAYQHYVALKKDMESELTFQKRFLNSLKFFQTAARVKGNPEGFLEKVGDMNGYFTAKPAQAENVLEASRDVLKERLAEVIPYYKNRIKGKSGTKPFDPTLYRIPQFKQVKKLYSNSGVTPAEDIKKLSAFITDYDKNAAALQTGLKGRDAVLETVIKSSGFPKTKFFIEQATALGDLQAKAPKKLGADYGEYLEYPCAVELNKEIAALNESLEKGRGEYTEAEEIVRKVFPMLEAEQFSEALGMLKEKKHLPFLQKKYAALDQASVKHQAAQIGEALSSFSWGTAEQGLYKLHKDENFIDPVKIAPLKKETVSEMEDSLYIKVDVLTRHKVNKFVEERWSEVEEVDSLYTDSVFLPAHDVTFTTGGKAALLKRREDLTVHLAKLKDDEFPAKAIKLLYKEFLKKPSDNGVKKARAVVAHGKHYKGEDKEIKRRIHECDPWGPKWLVKPTKYRRVFALPITTRKGLNTYLCRLNIRAKTEAKFPVYDVNIKLPSYVAKKAGDKKWFDKITLDKKQLKSEGRFSITSPTEANGYETQITPVRMKKDKNNFLDIYFKYNGLKVIPISVMVQKPIIKKN